MLRFALAMFASLLFSGAVQAAPNPDWTTALPPFQIADNLFYVGSRDLASYLIVTPGGNILINANLETSPPQIRASVERLGFRWADTRLLLNGQAHFDHMAGAAEIVRETHAQNLVMAGDDEAIRTGGRKDFSFGMDGILPFAPVPVDRVLQDGERVELGGVVLTAHKTAGHTRGCTTWTLRAHVPGEPAGRLRNVVIVGGWSALSDYRLVDSAAGKASYPGIAEDFQRTFGSLRKMPCDIFLGSHGLYFDMLEKLARSKAHGPSVWIDPKGYRETVNDAKKTFQENLAIQRRAAVA